MTYARSRLWLGISGVGASVLLACATIATGWPARYLPASPAVSLPVQLAHVAGVLALQLLLFLPLDYAGGAMVVPPDMKRQTGWFGRWLRGAAVLYLVSLLGAGALLLAGRAGGTGAAWLTGVAGGVLLLALNGTLAQLVAAFRLEPADESVRKAAVRAGVNAGMIRLVSTDEPAFTGAWMGLDGRTLWLPRQWAAHLEPDELAAALARRAAVRRVRWQGILLALGWNGLGLWFALGAPGGGATTAAEFVTTAAWFTLWQFAGVLLLPSLSRPAVFEADAVAAVRVGADPTYRAIARLDEWQEGEPARAEGVEAIFHPVPQLTERVRRLQAGKAAEPLGPGFYHATRTMLATGWAFGGSLGRAVHCNLGRPALWVIYPSD